MEILYERYCGIDVHKKMVMACIYVKRKKEIREFGTMTDELMELVRWIREQDCQMVAMESTGVGWKPVYNLLEEEGIETIVMNAQHIKNVPGRKTNVKDARGFGIRTEQFPSPKHFASWCGIVPGNNESAGKKKSTRIRKGKRFIKSTIVECARAAIRCKNSYFYAKYCKIAARRGGRALIAVAHSVPLAIFHILVHNQHFVDLRSDYFDTIQAARIMNRNIKSLQKPGFDVSLSSTAPA